MKLTGVVIFCPVGPGGQAVRISLDPPGSRDTLEFFIRGDEKFERGDTVEVKVKKT